MSGCEVGAGAMENEISLTNEERTGMEDRPESRNGGAAAEVDRNWTMAAEERKTPFMNGFVLD